MRFRKIADYTNWSLIQDNWFDVEDISKLLEAHTRLLKYPDAYHYYLDIMSWIYSPRFDNKEWLTHGYPVGDVNLNFGDDFYISIHEAGLCIYDIQRKLIKRTRLGLIYFGITEYIAVQDMPNRLTKEGYEKNMKNVTEYDYDYGWYRDWSISER